MPSFSLTTLASVALLGYFGWTFWVLYQQIYPTIALEDAHGRKLPAIHPSWTRGSDTHVWVRLSANERQVAPGRQGSWNPLLAVFDGQMPFDWLETPLSIETQVCTSRGLAAGRCSLAGQNASLVRNSVRSSPIIEPPSAVQVKEAKHVAELLQTGRPVYAHVFVQLLRTMDSFGAHIPEGHRIAIPRTAVLMTPTAVYRPPATTRNLLTGRSAISERYPSVPGEWAPEPGAATAFFASDLDVRLVLDTQPYPMSSLPVQVLASMRIDGRGQRVRTHSIDAALELARGSLSVHDGSPV